MDQDAFRQLLSAPRPPTASGAARRTIQTVDASQPIFKPRKAATKPNTKTKSNAKRAGLGFKPSATARATIDEYDDQPPPFMGLDFAAIEKEKMKVSAAENDDMDDMLEQTYQGLATDASPALPAESNSAPKKRTREEIVNELKAKRQKTVDEGADKALDDAKKAGKFRPIGAPEPKAKVKKAKTGADGKPKKKKPIPEGAIASAPSSALAAVTVPTASTSTPAPSAQGPTADRDLHPPPSQEPEDDGFGDGDIFADVDEYKGLDDDDDSDVESPPKRTAAPSPPPASTGLGPVKWFQLDEDGEAAPAPQHPPSPPPGPSSRQEREATPEVERLVPLASSSFSIKDVLAMDKELEKEEKRKAKKEKKKKGGEDAPGADKKKLSGEAKATRDLQKLESYTKKRG